MMKKIIYFFVLLGLIISLFSCVILPNLKKDFYTYKLPIIQYGNEIPIKINGVYVQKSTHFNDAFYFYSNGSVKSSSFLSDFWQNPGDKVKEIQNFYIYNSKEHWGHYLIQEDTLIIQLFSRNNQEFFKRQVIEYKGVIQSDTSFVIISGYHYLDKHQFINQPITYLFYPTNIKPDSTKAWFNNKKWYKKNLNECRKDIISAN